MEISFSKMFFDYHRSALPFWQESRGKRFLSFMAAPKARVFLAYWALACSPSNMDMKKFDHLASFRSCL
jgi:hypothetical protein